MIAGILAVLWKRVDLQRATRAAYSLIYGQSACLLVSYRPLVIIEGILSFRLILRYLRAERTRGTGNSLPVLTGRHGPSGAKIDKVEPSALAFGSDRAQIPRDTRRKGKKET